MSLPYTTRERCGYCDEGKVDGDPIPSLDGPYYPSLQCQACNGDGWVLIESLPVGEADLEGAFG